MNKITATIECEVPDGYEPVRYGLPGKRDLYITTEGKVQIAASDCWNSPRLIVRKKITSRWANAYDGQDVTVYSTRAAADICKCGDRKSIIRLDFEGDTLVGFEQFKDADA